MTTHETPSDAGAVLRHAGVAVLRPFYVVENGRNLEIRAEYSPGVPCGVPVSIGSTSLVFKPGRYGAKRGEAVKYRAFSETDKETVNLIAAAPELAAGLERAINCAEHVLRLCEANLAAGVSPSVTERAHWQGTVAECYAAMAFVTGARAALAKAKGAA